MRSGSRRAACSARRSPPSAPNRSQSTSTASGAPRRHGRGAGESARGRWTVQTVRSRRYVSLTNHMWSGFNLLANRGLWLRLPANVRTVIERNTTKYVRLQRRIRMRSMPGGAWSLPREADVQHRRSCAVSPHALSGVYASWRDAWCEGAGRCSKPRRPAGLVATLARQARGLSAANFAGALKVCATDVRPMRRPSPGTCRYPPARRRAC
jgi:hypothetical protein